MKKQILIGVLTSSIIFSGVSTFAKAETSNLLEKPINAEIELNKTINLKDIKTYEKGNTEMVPLREVAENILGLKVIWKGEDKSVEIGEGPEWTSIKIGENSYFFARVAPFKLSQAPEVKDGLTYVPVEFFTEVLKYKISTEETSNKDEHILDGFIKDVNEVDGRKTILVAGNESRQVVDEILLHVNKDTVIVDKNNKSVSFDDLKIGTKVKVVLPEIMTMSLPAQGSAIKITVEDKNVEIIKTGDKINKDIIYPQVKGLEGQLIEDYINQEIENFVKEHKQNELYKDLKLDFEISFLNNDKISILFRGTYNFNGSEKYLVKSLNFDLKSNNEITFENYFKDDKESQEKLMNLLNKAAKEQGLSEFEAEGKWIQFKGSNVIVFYYALDDSVTIPTELYIPLEDIKDIINNSFGG